MQEAFRRFETNLNRGDYAAALAFYADDPRFVAYEDGQTRYSSYADLAAAFKQLPTYGKGVFRYGKLEVLVLGDDHAQVAAPFSTAFGEVGDPGYFYFEGLLTTVLERFDSGWKMLSIHSSTLQARE
ncbi:MAG: nuclear transport factor 2 family protein [Pseudomonadota bacterium]